MRELRSELVGGRLALEAEYPSTVYIGNCTATKIAKFQFLTASHCAVNNPEETLRSSYLPGSPFPVTTDNDRLRSRNLTIVETRLPTPFYYTASLLSPDAPDIAVVTVAEETPDIPVALVDTTTVVGGDALVKTGYGCDEVTFGSPYPLRVFPALALSQAVIEQYYSPETVARTVPSVVHTAKDGLDPGAASLCPGDSGGPLYRDVSPELLVVGVNSRAASYADYHSRVDGQAAYGVGAWLAAGGARVRSAIGGSPYLAEPVSVPGTVEAENYDADGDGVAYVDTTPENQGGSYRDDDVDVLGASGVSNGQFVRASAGEWLEYTVSAELAGEYLLELRLAGSTMAGPALRVALDNEDSLGPISVPLIDPAAWQTVTTASIALTPGKNRLRVSFERALDIDSVQLNRVTLPCEDESLSLGETDVDCGGLICSRCDAGRTCVQHSDCISAYCNAGHCADPCNGGICTFWKPVGVDAGDKFACARFADGAIRCWGDNSYGQLGLPPSPPIGDEPGEVPDLAAVQTDGPATSFALGTTHACAIVDGGSVQCWGRNHKGQLGAGDTLDRSVPVTADLGEPAAELALGAEYSCARLASGAVKCWGGNSFGQLGIGSTQNKGDQPGEMGTALVAVQLPGAARTIAAGAQHTCAINAGKVRCWGAGLTGQLGMSQLIYAFGDAPSELTPPAVELGTGFNAWGLALGSVHTCARSLSASVKCWGNNGFAQLGLGDTMSRGTSPAQMGDNLPVVPLPEATSPLVAHGYVTCARGALFGGLRCWGYGSSVAQPSLGTPLGDQPGEIASVPPIDLGAPTITMATGQSFACALLAEDKVKCWGMNDVGQLGLGDTEWRGDVASELGANLPPLQFATP